MAWCPVEILCYGLNTIFTCILTSALFLNLGQRKTLLPAPKNPNHVTNINSNHSRTFRKQITLGILIYTNTNLFTTEDVCFSTEMICVNGFTTEEYGVRLMEMLYNK